jgi:hypothetical protein
MLWLSSYIYCELWDNKNKTIRVEEKRSVHLSFYSSRPTLTTAVKLGNWNMHTSKKAYVLPAKTDQFYA